MGCVRFGERFVRKARVFEKSLVARVCAADQEIESADGGGFVKRYLRRAKTKNVPSDSMRAP